jgi:hypothetical protein
MKTPIDILRDKYFTTGILHESDFTKADFQLEELLERANCSCDIIDIDYGIKKCIKCEKIFYI